MSSVDAQFERSCVVVGADRTYVRWLMLALIFTITTVLYADRSSVAIVGPVISKDLGLTPSQMGLVFSAFGWSYVIFMIPSGWMLDKFGTRMIYGGCLALWSLFTVMQGFVGFVASGLAIGVLFVLRFLVGMAESPSFPGNSRVVSSWFPSKERATASAIFNSAQYFATVVFAPIMGWITTFFGWPWVFGMTGGLGVVLTLTWLKVAGSPVDSEAANQAEIDYIAAGGGLVRMDQAAVKTKDVAEWGFLGQLLRNRMMVGIFIGQYCINAITYFFLTWFPVYLVQARGMTILKAGFLAMLPAICGFLGGILGGIVSDWMLRRGYSLSVARKTPIVLGMTVSMAMIACNYTDLHALIIVLMALSFFGKGFGALGWAVMSDAAPREIIGLAGAVFNTCGSLSAISTPLIIGVIIQATGSFNGALVFVAANGLAAAISYLFVVGEIKRMVLVKH